MKILIVITSIILLLLLLKQRNIKNNNNLDKKNILVMFSGGLDSTVTLYYLLKNTKAKIFVHHIINEDINEKSNEELVACNNLLNEFKKIRNFEFTTSKYSYFTDNIDRKTGGSRQDDLSLVIFQAIRFCTVRNYLNIDHIVIADSKYDRHDKWDNYFKKSIDAVYYNHWDGKKPTSLDVLNQFNTTALVSKETKLFIKNNILKDIKLPYEVNSNISNNEIIYKIAKIAHAKRNMYNYLPNNIQKLVLSCRNSKNGIKCGQCFKCKHETLYIN